MKYREEFMEALRLCEIFVPPMVRGLYQVVLEGITVALAELSPGKTAEEKEMDEMRDYYRKCVEVEILEDTDAASKEKK